MFQFSQFHLIQCHPGDKVRLPKFLNGVWKHKITEFGGCCLEELIKEPRAYRLMVTLLKKFNGGGPKIACIVRIRVAAFQIFRLGPRSRDSRERGAISGGSSETVRVLRWPHWPAEGS
jgi:hypothetical protein